MTNRPFAFDFTPAIAFNRKNKPKVMAQSIIIKLIFSLHNKPSVYEANKTIKCDSITRTITSLQQKLTDCELTQTK